MEEPRWQLQLQNFEEGTTKVMVLIEVQVILENDGSWRTYQKKSYSFPRSEDS